MTRPWSRPDRDAGDATAPTGPDDHVIDVEVEGEAAHRLVDPTDDHADTEEPPRDRSTDWRRVAGIVIAVAFALGVTAVVVILGSDDVEAPTEPTPAPDDTVTATLPPVEEDEQDEQDDGDAASANLMIDRQAVAEADIRGALTQLYVVVEEAGDISDIVRRYYVEDDDVLTRVEIDLPDNASTTIYFQVLDEIDIPLPDIDEPTDDGGASDASGT